MKISDFVESLQPIGIKGACDAEVRGLCYDSRKLVAGDLFFAVRGEVADGHQFIEQAIEAGAVGIVLEQEHPLAKDVACVQVKDARRAMAIAAKYFHGDPTASMKVVGITGTNGKTTISYLVESLLKEAGRNAAVVGTVEYRYGDRVLPAPNTTPEAVDLQLMAADFSSQGCDGLVMEVSSHALAQQRIAGVDIDVAVFTNLTPEHLDYHREMESYYAAKRLLFVPEGRQTRPTAVVNIDDAYGARLAVELENVISCGKGADASVRLISADLTMDGVTARAMTPLGEITIVSPLLGTFNLSNLLCAAGVGVALGCDTATIERGLSQLANVPGRLEQIENQLGARVLVDYAHTGDALEKVLEALVQLEPKRLLTVFGCGGDRDRSKRPVMGEVAGRLSSLAIVTSDNPRTEDPDGIIDDIRPGLEEVFPRELTRDEAASADAKGYVVIADRKEAIDFAAGLIGAGDVLLVAGKGHEDYQIVGEERFHFDDREELRRALNDRDDSR